MKISRVSIISFILTILIVVSSIPVSSFADGECHFDDTSSYPVSQKSDYSYVDDIVSEKIAEEHADELSCRITDYVDKAQFESQNYAFRVEQDESLNTYVFQKEDGKRVVYFMDENVKFIDDNGEVKEKKLSLTSTEKGFSPACNDIDILLPTTIKESIQFNYGKSSIAITPSGDNYAEGKSDGKSVSYTGVFGENTILRYTPMLSGLKEDIIVTDKTAPIEFSLILKTNGAFVYSDKDGFYLATFEQSEEKIRLGTVVAYDSKGHESIGNLLVNTVTEGSEYVVTVSIDSDFLVNESTVFPVTIDPTFIVSDNTHGSNAIQDAPIFQNKSSINFGTFLYDRVGTPDNNYGVGRTVVKLSGFTTATEYTTITASQIDSVLFYAKESSGGNTQTINLHPITGVSTWTENTVTWNTIGSSFDTSVDFGTTMYNSEWSSFDITNLVKGWKTGAYTADCGFILKNSNESNNKCFDSCECSTTGIRPYVVMTYDPGYCGGDSFNDAEIINLNTYHAVNIDTPNVLKYFKFIPSSTGFYTFECTDRLSGDPCGRLYNSSEEQIAFNDDGASNLKFRLTYHLMTGITYYFTAGCYGTTTGIYDFKIVKTTTSSHIIASTLSVGSQRSVSINLPYKAKIYKFTPSVSEEYLFVSSDNTGDPRIWLYDSSLNQVGYNDDGAGDYNFKLSSTLTAGQTYYIVINQFSNSVGTCKSNLFVNADLGQITATGLYASSAGVIYNFIPQTSGTYCIETERPVGVAEQDTVAYLLDSNYNLISSNDNKDSFGNNYSQLTATLTAGQKYKVIITSNAGSLSINCYIAVYKSLSLYGPVSGYAGFVKQFKKIGNYTNLYNCLAYALGITNYWVWPWGTDCPSLSQVDDYMVSNGYTRVSQYQSNCIVAYGLTSSQITHFSKVVADTVTAKCGGWELMEHKEYDAYFAEGDYGSPQAFYVKVPSDRLMAGQSTESIINDSHTIINIDSYFSKLDKDVARDIEVTLDQLVIRDNMLISSYDLVDNSNDSYNTIKNFGNESVPYILNYVIKSDNNGLFEAFLIASVAKMLNYNSLPGCVESNNKYSCEYEEYSPKYFAYQILATFANNSNE